MPTKKVFVYDNEGKLRVYPPVIVLTAGDELQIVNSSNQNIEVDIPDGVFDESTNKEKVHVGGSMKSAKKVKSPAAAQAAVYTVRGLSSQKKAKGNSDPVIIIDT